eukprot:scaffold3649_cov108-Isochrysis_galbana.AAC.7
MGCDAGTEALRVLDLCVSSESPPAAAPSPTLPREPQCELQCEQQCEQPRRSLAPTAPPHRWPVFGRSPGARPPHRAQKARPCMLQWRVMAATTPRDGPSPSAGPPSGSIGARECGWRSAKKIGGAAGAAQERRCRTRCGLDCRPAECLAPMPRPRVARPRRLRASRNSRHGTSRGHAAPPAAAAQHEARLTATRRPPKSCAWLCMWCLRQERCTWAKRDRPSCCCLRHQGPPGPSASRAMRRQPADRPCRTPTLETGESRPSQQLPSLGLGDPRPCER